MYLFQYAQPRLASFNPNVVIHERREVTLRNTAQTLAYLEVQCCLKEESVICGGRTYHRTFISLQEIPPFD